MSITLQTYFCILRLKHTISLIQAIIQPTTHKQQKTNYSLHTGEKTYKLVLRKTPNVSKSIFNYATLRAQSCQLNQLPLDNTFRFRVLKCGYVHTQSNPFDAKTIRRPPPLYLHCTYFRYIIGGYFLNSKNTKYIYIFSIHSALAKVYVVFGYLQPSVAQIPLIICSY